MRCSPPAIRFLTPTRSSPNTNARKVKPPRPDATGPGLTWATRAHAKKRSNEVTKLLGPPHDLSKPCDNRGCGNGGKKLNAEDTKVGDRGHRGNRALRRSFVTSSHRY